MVEVAAPLFQRSAVGTAISADAKHNEQPRSYTYKGFAASAPGEKLKLIEYDLGGPIGPNEVEIKVSHNGLCFTDIHMRDNDWGFSSYPLIPGHEVVGVVQAVGSQVTCLQPGSRVGVGWMIDSCRHCSNCTRGNENLCVDGYKSLYVGPGNYGGFQPFMRAPADFCYPLPDNLGSAEAAPLLCAGVTMYAPLRRFVTRPGMHVAVLGLGGLGHLGVQFADKMGAMVTVIGRDTSKAEEARQLGASRYLTFEDALQTCRGTIDIILNSCPADVDYKAMMTLLAPDGVAVQTGIPGGSATVQLDLQDLVWSQKAFAGSIVGGRADMNEMLAFCANKGIKPMIEVMKLSQVNEAMERLLQGKPRYRIVLETDV